MNYLEGVSDFHLNSKKPMSSLDEAINCDKD